MKFSEYLETPIEAPELFADLTISELEELWTFLSKAPLAMFSTYRGTQSGVVTEVSTVFWDVAVQLDSRDT